MHDVGTGGDKPRPYKPEFMPHGVGDGLVPSRVEFMHDVGTGGDKPRPYQLVDELEVDRFTEQSHDRTA